MYNVGVSSIERSFEKLYKYAERTEDGVFQSEAIGTYLNYKISFGGSRDDPEDYDDLYELLILPNQRFTVSVPYGYSKTLTYEAYTSSGKDKIVKKMGENVFWNSLSVNFIAINPLLR